jgi:hypothetical protein
MQSRKWKNKSRCEKATRRIKEIGTIGAHLKNRLKELVKTSFTRWRYAMFIFQ